LCYAGDPAKGEKLIEPLRSFGTPLGEHIGVQPYCAWQQAFVRKIVWIKSTSGLIKPKHPRLSFTSIILYSESCDLSCLQ
jgi:hypothetical protein